MNSERIDHTLFMRSILVQVQLYNLSLLAHRVHQRSSVIDGKGPSARGGQFAQRAAQTESSQPAWLKELMLFLRQRDAHKFQMPPLEKFCFDREI